MVRANNSQINQDRAHTRKRQSTRIQRRNIYNRCHHQGRTIHRKCQPRRRNPTHGPTKAFGTINRTLLWATLCKKGIQIDKIKHIIQGHRGTRLAPKYKEKYGAPSANNIGVFQGSAIIAILFIIYMGDMMEDNAALSRRSNLPTRIVLD